MLEAFPSCKITRESKHTEKTNGSNDVGSINAKRQQERVDKGVERSGESSTAEEGTDTFRGIRALHGEVGLLGKGGHHAGTNEREDGEDRQSHFDGGFRVGSWSFEEERSSCCDEERIAIVDDV